MDNHQLELAVELDKQGYLRRGHIGLVYIHVLGRSNNCSVTNYSQSKLHEDVERVEKFEPANWPPKPPKNSKYRHVGDMINDLFPSKHISEASNDEVQKMPPEKQMWRDLLAGQPFPEGDPRHIFLNGHTSEKKEAMFQEWRQNWYDGRKIRAQLEGKSMSVTDTVPKAERD